jgi:hypothetical protein
MTSEQLFSLKKGDMFWESESREYYGIVTHVDMEDKLLTWHWWGTDGRDYSSRKFHHYQLKEYGNWIMLTPLEKELL